MTATSSSDGAVRMTLHPGEDVLVRPGVRLGDVRVPLAALLRRPELRWATLTADGVRVADEQVVGERPLLPGAVLGVGVSPGVVLGVGPAPEVEAGPGGVGGADRRGGLDAPWLVVRATGPDAGTVVGTRGPWAALRRWVRLRGGGRLAIRRSRGPAAWLAPPPEAAANGLSWPLVLLPAVASLILAAVLRQPVLAMFALVSLVVAAPQLRAARQRGAGTGTVRNGARALPGPARLLAFAHAALHVSPAAWAAARDAGAAARARAARSVGAGPVAGPGLPSAPDDPLAALLHDGAVAVLGPADLARSVARALVAGLAVRGASVRLADDGQSAAWSAGWSWLRWLPEGGPRVLVVDGSPAPFGPAPAGPVASRGAGAVTGAPASDAAPSAVVSVGVVLPGCRAVVQVLNARRVRITGPDGATRAVPLVGVSAGWAERLARLLAGAAWLGRTAGALGSTRTADTTGHPDGPAPRPDDSRLPVAVSLTRAHGVDEVPGPRQVAMRWAAADHRADAAGRARADRRTGTDQRPDAKGRAGAGGWAVPLGLDADGAPVLLDLVRDGPHLLVAGTTGSGKSELLQTLVLGLALARSPAELALVLVDFKGGASLGVCGRLPHVVGRVTDLEPGLAARALTGLRAELRRRERVLAAHGVADVVALAPGVLPRLVVVIDEFRALADDLPAFLPGLLRIAAQGRSLGVHLVLATQRPGGAVGPDLRANVSARIALRVTEPLESRDVVDDAAAARIPARTPGRAVLRLGTAPPVVFQCAHATASPEARLPLVRRAPAAQHEHSPEPGLVSDSALGPDVATLVVDAVGGAAESLDLRPGPPPWLPPLPRSAGSADLPPATRRDRGGLVLALGDDPDAQRRTTVAWHPAAGHLAILGRARSGRTTALVTLALAALRQGWTVHGITRDDAALAPLRHHPGYAGTSYPDDAGTLDALLSAGTGATRPDHPGTLVLVDGVEDVRGALPLAALRSGVVLAVTADGPSVGGLAARIGPRLVLLGTDRAADVMLGAPALLAGAGGPPGRAAWCDRGDPVLCQVLEPELGPPHRPHTPRRPRALSPPSASPTSPLPRTAS
ncbi:FtsK/SpoIIIE domain-containing protein [Promicromonospora sukumoe]|uniref:FtsK/SpoIIIE domain-containing protein n=1 Tax=Promicromonospora sukumoe TaxID=88382 RepID=UPI0003684F46|nr:FtsK/SpoIIIE domain-containing protein [Promicromonospora sukumoe]